MTSVSLSQTLREPRHWPTLAGLGVLRALAPVPLPVLHMLGSLLGEALCLAHGARRRVTRRNLEACFPELGEPELERLVRHTFRRVARSMLAAGIGWWAGQDRLQRLVQTRNRHFYDDVLASRRPLILLAPHFVALEIGGIFLSRERPMVSMYQKTRNDLLDRFVLAGRGRFGLVMIERKAELRGLIRAIRAGQPFYYLPDQDPGRRRAVFAPFFGIETATFPTLARIAALSGAAVIPCITRERPRGLGYEIEFQPPVADFPAADDRTSATIMNRVIEAAIRPDPSQYFWIHKRFKTRPPGEPEFYPR